MKKLLALLLLVAGTVHGQTPTWAPWVSEGGTSFNAPYTGNTTGVTIGIVATWGGVTTTMTDGPLVVYLTAGNDLTLTATRNLVGGNMTYGMWVKQTGQVTGSSNDGWLLNSTSNGVYTFSNLIEGVYYFTYKTKNLNTNYIYHRTVKVIVRSNSTLPYASAGNDTVVWMHQHDFVGLEYFRLNGDNSVGSDGTAASISSYTWEQMSGPTTLVMTGASSANATTSRPQLGGTYTFKLTINQFTASEKSQTRTYKFIDRNTLSSAKQHRTGGGIEITVPPSRSGTDSNGVKWVEWIWPNLTKTVLDSTGQTIMGDDILVFDMTGRDSCSNVKLNGFGGTPGHDVILSPKTPKPVKISGMDAQFLIGGKASNKLADNETVSHVTVDGGRHKGSGTAFGWQFENDEFATANPTVPGATDMQNFSCSDIKFINCYFSGYNIFQIKRISHTSGWSLYNRYWIKNVLFLNCIFKDARGEAVYAGDTDQDGNKDYSWYNVPPRMDNFEFRNCIVMRVGWDALQLANVWSGAKVTNCLLMDVANKSAVNQQSSLQLGGNTNGHYEGNIILNNVSTNAGNGVEAFGHGENTYKNNIVLSTPTGSSLYMKWIKYEPIYKNQPHKAIIQGNVFGGFKYDAITQIAGDGFMGAGTISGNTIIHPTETNVANLISVQPESGNVISGNTIKKSFAFSVSRDIVIGDTSFIITATVGGVTKTYRDIKTLSDAGLLEAGQTVNNAPVITMPDAISVTAPATFDTLRATATDPEGSAMTYAWTKTAGAAVTFTSANSLNTRVDGLAPGSYEFLLTVSDGTNTTTAKQFLTVSAEPPPDNAAPVAAAGADASIKLSSVELNGTGSSDPDGDDLTYAWSVVSKPVGSADPVFSAAGASITTVSGMITGTYQYKLTVKDTKGETNSDTIIVTVLPADPNTTFGEGKAGKIYKGKTF